MRYYTLYHPKVGQRVNLVIELRIFTKWRNARIKIIQIKI